MAGTTRTIAANTAVSYTRALIALVLGFFASRWTLQALGASDFGISVTAGALVAFGTFAGDMLRFSVLRHLAFAVGGGKRSELNEWMRAACITHLALACITTLIIWPIGEWSVRALIRIPPERLCAALTMFRCSLTMVFITTATVPFCAIFTAHQRFLVPNVVTAARSLWLFAWAFWLTKSSGDRLSSYAIYSLSGLAVAQSAIILCSFVRFGSLEWKCGIHWKKVREIASFAGWNTFGGGGYLIATQGTAFVTNSFFGPLGNAAYGIAAQVQTHAEALAIAITGAFAPAVTSRRGSGDGAGMRRLAAQAGLLVPLLIAFFAVPLVAEMQTVLEIWLVTPPPCAAPVCAIILSAGALNKLTMGQQLAITAEGRISRWQILCGVMHALSLPLSIILAACGCGVISAAAAFAGGTLLCLAGNLYFGEKIAAVKARRWAAEVALPFALTVPAAVAASLLPRLWMNPGILRVLAASAASSGIFAISLLIMFIRWKRSSAIHSS